MTALDVAAMCCAAFAAGVAVASSLAIRWGIWRATPLGPEAYRRGYEAAERRNAAVERANREAFGA